MTEVRLCVWHLRKVFWDERLWKKYQDGELGIIRGALRKRTNPTEEVPDAEYNQEITLTDPANGDTQVARLHCFIAADRVSLCASGYPDPKQITWEGFDYHGNGKGQCDHCLAGITTYPVHPRHH
jgi:hypothetical protein